MEEIDTHLFEGFQKHVARLVVLGCFATPSLLPRDGIRSAAEALTKLRESFSSWQQP